MTLRNRRRVSRNRKLPDDSSKDQLISQAQMRENQSQMDRLYSKNQTLMARIAILTEENGRQTTFLGQVGYILTHPACIAVIIAIILGAGLYLHLTKQIDSQATEIDGYKIKFDNMNSEIHKLREQNATLTQQNYHEASEIDGYKIKLDNMNSEIYKLLEKNTALTEKNYRQASEVDAKNTEIRHLQDQIEMANQHSKFMQDQMIQMGELQKQNEQAMIVHLQESEWSKQGVNYLVQCLQDAGSASSKVELSLFWGLVQVGYATQSGHDNCVKMYKAQYLQIS